MKLATLSVIAGVWLCVGVGCSTATRSAPTPGTDLSEIGEDLSRPSGLTTPDSTDSAHPQTADTLHQHAVDALVTPVLPDVTDAQRSDPDLAPPVDVLPPPADLSQPTPDATLPPTAKKLLDGPITSWITPPSGIVAYVIQSAGWQSLSGQLRVVDIESGSSWKLSGLGTAGPLQGRLAGNHRALYIDESMPGGQLWYLFDGAKASLLGSTNALGSFPFGFDDCFQAHPSGGLLFPSSVEQNQEQFLIALSYLAPTSTSFQPKPLDSEVICGRTWFSPNGRYLAYSTWHDDGGFGIPRNLVLSDTTSAQQWDNPVLSQNYGGLEQPVFTTDSSRIIYYDDNHVRVRGLTGNEDWQFPPQTFGTALQVVADRWVFFPPSQLETDPLFVGDLTTQSVVTWTLASGTVIAAHQAGEFYHATDHGPLVHANLSGILKTIDAQVDLQYQSPQRVGDRLVYVALHTENGTTAPKLRTWTPGDPGPITVALNISWSGLSGSDRHYFAVTADQTAVLFLTHSMLYRYNLATHSRTWLAGDVRAFHYFAQTNAVLYVTGSELSADKDAEGLYWLPF